MNDEIFRYWGKYNNESWHPVLCHMLDVGIVAHELFYGLPNSIKKRLEGVFGLSEMKLLNLIAFFAALHDIGKISPGFQKKNTQFFNILHESGHQFPEASETLHGQVSLDILPDLLMDELGCSEDLALGFSSILAAHHGVFAGEEGFGSGDGPWKDGRLSVMKYLSDLFEIDSLAGVNTPPIPVLMILAGLVCVADWIASSEENFVYTSGTPASLPQYIEERFDIAKRLVETLKMTNNKIELHEFKDLFGFDNPNACQAATIHVTQRLSHPMLIAVESPMGSGKTEAALSAFSEIAAKSDIGGLFYALPTQATGNAMLPRMEKFLKNLKPKGGAELHLLHGNADLNRNYEALRLSSVNAGEGDMTASTWFMSRKRGLLSGYGVGTIDQALMAALKVRHFFVRLFGLSGKVLILDEVHAYDVYMQEEIFSLIGWLGQCGTSIILLSATLPRYLRQKLFQAFIPNARVDESVDYPCVTGIDLNNKKIVTMPIVDEAPDPISVELLVTDLNNKKYRILDILKTRLSDGGSAACIVNTVKEAQDLYRLVKNGMPDAETVLFHSRFTKGRRLVIEEQILSTWGKNGNRPEKGIVVATQVIEQSLDVDFDLMISDLAPADLLLQRAGRLHRHHMPSPFRPEKLKTRSLVVTIPDYQNKVPDFGDSGYVYEKDILTRTALWVSPLGCETNAEVTLPGNGIDWIETVYNASGCIPGHLSNAMDLWEKERKGEEMAQEFIARTNTLCSVHNCLNDIDYLLDLSNDFNEDKMITTRLGNESITLVILERDVFKPSHRDEIRKLLSQSVDVSTRKIIKSVENLESPEDWMEIPQLRNARPLIIQNGQALFYPGLIYNDETGLELCEI
ncbi:MAG: CRISPR-associated helicase Cas3' [Proteobacteria bacterium]|nr:CRISPR-associated helicase Cas3' [Pseudomonadota bacterium]